MRNYLNRLLAVGIMSLSALELVGCNAARQLGCRNDQSPTLKSSEVKEGDATTGSIAHRIGNGIVDSAGPVGWYGGYSVGYGVGGGLGATIGALYALCNHDQHFYKVMGECADNAANRLAPITASVGERVGQLTARLLVFCGSYVKWGVCTAYNKGVAYFYPVPCNSTADDDGDRFFDARDEFESEQLNPSDSKDSKRGAKDESLPTTSSWVALLSRFTSGG